MPRIFGLYFLLRVLRFSLEALVGIFPVTLGRRIIGSGLSVLVLRFRIYRVRKLMFLFVELLFP